MVVKGEADRGSMTYTESRSKVVRMAAIALGFIAVGVWWGGGLDSGEWSSPLPMVLMVLSLFLGAARLVYFAPRLVGPPRALLVVDDDGFDDHASLMSVGRVQWVEVTELTLVRIGGNDNIAIAIAVNDLDLDITNSKRDRSLA